MRICLVTEELSFGKGAGGIGGAFHELALLLARSGYETDLIYLPVNSEAKPRAELLAYFADRGIRVSSPDPGHHAWAPLSYEKRSYALFQHLRKQETPYDVVHFHDYKGLGYFCLAAKQQRLAFGETRLVVQVHGPTRWALQANGHPFTHEDQLKIDFMERESIARADILVSPSRYMLDWLAQNGWKTPPTERVQVIQNVCGHLLALIGGDEARARAASGFDEIIFFGRHEERKGLVPFCDAIDLIRDRLAETGVQLSFLGGFGAVNGDDSAIYLANRSRRWRFPLRVLPDLDRVSAVRFLAENERSLVVIPSRVENSPYTVLEAIIAGKPLLTSVEGGARELLDETSACAMTCEIARGPLAERIAEAVRAGLPTPRLAVAPTTTEQLWLALHEATAVRRAPAVVSPRPAKRREGPPRATPKVVAAITHHERPEKLYEAVLSLAGQTYPNLELVIVDDGSHNPETLDALARLEPLFGKLGGRLIRQENRYLGAARNRAAAETQSDYILFLDDDDIAFPTLVQTLVTAAEASEADIVNCLNLFMPEARRGEAYPFPDRFEQKVSYVPIGGPLSVSPFENCFGAATALIRRASFTALGGYTEEYGVGHEDFELYVRAAQAGMRIEICPLPLYLYEVDRPSMVQSTSRLRNWDRVVRALDPTTNASEWLDLASLNAGRRAQEHINNNADYRRRTSPQSELLSQIAAHRVSGAEYAALVGEYAQRTGSPAFARAMQHLAQTRTASTNARDAGAGMLLPPLIQEVDRAARRPQRSNELMLGALVDLCFGRVAEAVAAFRLSRDRSQGGLDASELGFLRRLCRHREATADDLRPVVGILSRLKLTLDGFEQAAPIIFHLALRVGEAALALGVLDRALSVDEEVYVARQANAGAPIPESGFASALEHYLHCGEEQGGEEAGGVGFALSRALKRALTAELGIEPPLASFRQYIVALANGQPAEVREQPRTAARALGRANGQAHPDAAVSGAAAALS